MLSFTKKLPLFLSGKLYLLGIATLLFAVSLISENNLVYVSQQQKAVNLLQQYVQQSEKDFNDIYKEGMPGNELSETSLQDLKDQPFYLYTYKEKNGSYSLSFWTSNKILPPLSIIKSKDSTGFIALANGYYTWFKKIRAKTCTIALLPVKWNYFVSNAYLKNNFVVDRNELLSQNFDIAAGGGNTSSIKFLNGSDAFHLVPREHILQSHSSWLSVILRLAGFFLILLYLHFSVSWLATTKNIFLATGVLIGCLLVLRYLSYVLDFPVYLRQWELFDPAIYGSNAINRSLGALLINILLGLWIIIFFRYHYLPSKFKVKPQTQVQTWILLLGSSLCFLFLTFAAANIVRSLVADAHISFDVLNFFSLSIYSVISFIILTCLAIAYYFFTHLVYQIIRPFLQQSVLPFFLCVTVSGLIYLSFKIGKMQEGFEIFVLIWLIIFLLLLSAEKFQVYASRFISSQVIFWLFFFSVSITIVIIRENNIKELRDRQQYAQVLSQRGNPATEVLLNSMLTDFRADYLAQNFYRFYDSTSAQNFKDSIVTNSFSGYKNRYVTRIFAFDSSETALNNSMPVSYNTLNTILTTQAKNTNIQGLFAYEESYDKYNYIIKKTILNTSLNVLGYVFIQVFPKNAQNESPYPELFNREGNNNLANNPDYAFAIYNDDKLVRSQNNHPFSTNIPPAFFGGKQFLLIEKEKYNELWYNAGPGKAVAIVKHNHFTLETVTLFSYFFCCFLLITALAWILQALIRSRFHSRVLIEYFTLTIREQIHGTIIFFSIISFIVIGAATILFFISRYETNNREKLSNTLHIIENQFLRSLTSNTLSDSLRQPLLPQVDSLKLASVFSEISDIHGVEINLYDPLGNLKFSSLPLPYNKGVISNKMDPFAYSHLHNANEVQYFQKENIGSLSYLSCYRPLINENGNTFAYLNIPYFTSESKLRDEISNFLVTIMNLNAFIFLIAGVVALFITNRITNTFLLIGEKMKAVNLGKTNEAIAWNRNDEIGKLVNEYNKMVAQLDESALILARTEREGAWEEMAKQVAHEIKNPLTPMRLSMQFLQKAIENDAPNVKELSRSVAQTLIEQIDYLSHMAGEFSRFARIEDSQMELLDMNLILTALKTLYNSTPSANFVWELTDRPVFIIADKTQMNRLFTNLIQNALQAVPDDKKGLIFVQQEIKDGKIFTTVKDNGSGISEEAREKIFVPNFTTKSAGTGLGLAMSKRIVEQSKGEISFESDSLGTAFCVAFPIADSIRAS